MAINDKIEKGTLIFNYNGHGGESGLGHEKFMQLIYKRCIHLVWLHN